MNKSINNTTNSNNASIKEEAKDTNNSSLKNTGNKTVKNAIGGGSGTSTNKDKGDSGPPKSSFGEAAAKRK